MVGRALGYTSSGTTQDCSLLGYSPLFSPASAPGAAASPPPSCRHVEPGLSTAMEAGVPETSRGHGGGDRCRLCRGPSGGLGGSPGVPVPAFQLSPLSRSCTSAVLHLCMSGHAQDVAARRYDQLGSPRLLYRTWESLRLSLVGGAGAVCTSVAASGFPGRPDGPDRGLVGDVLGPLLFVVRLRAGPGLTHWRPGPSRPRCLFTLRGVRGGPWGGSGASRLRDAWAPPALSSPYRVTSLVCLPSRRAGCFNAVDVRLAGSLMARAAPAALGLSHRLLRAAG
jgi:hypothetical protein